MNEFFKKRIEAFKNPKLIMFLGIAGMILILISSFFSGNSKSSNAGNSANGITAEKYRKELEKSITEIVKSITGSSKIKVIITLESGIKYSYADITEGASSNKSDDNSASESTETKQSYITIKDSDGSEKALLVTTQMPEIRGVAIVCEGGDNAEINEKISNAVTAALNITSKRVYIAGGN